MSEYPWSTLALHRAYDRTLPHWTEYRKLMAEVACALHGAARVLDAGCGSGILSERLVVRGHVVDGVDQNETMIHLAQERARRFPDRLRFSQQDATALTYPDASFDGVASTNVLFAVADPAKYLAELHRVLRVGGRLAITGPTPRAHAYVELLARNLCRELKRRGLASSRQRELAAVVAANRTMAKRGFGHTRTAKQIAALLSSIGFRIDRHHERLYRTALFFVAATKSTPPAMHSKTR